MKNEKLRCAAGGTDFMKGTDWRLLPCPMAPLCKGSCLPSRLRGCPSNRPSLRLASLVGTLPAGGSFCSVKRNQNPLRAFPPKDLPGVLVGTCAFLSPALDGSGHIDGVYILLVVPTPL